MKTYTAIELAEMVGEENIEQINEILTRNDGIAVYENHALDSHNPGHQRFFSFGSSRAQFNVPPDQLPDFPGEINWRYRLAGVYRSTKLLEPPKLHEFVSPLVVLERVTNVFRTSIIGHRDRLVSYGMEVKQFAHGPSHVTITVEATSKQGREPRQEGDALVGDVTITVQTWTNDSGEIDVLAPFSWGIEGAVEMTGGDPNLGATNVAVHNNSMVTEP